MVTGYIYKITCNINGKLYIGQTIQTLENRLYHHLRDAKVKNQNSAFYRAIRKYGEKCFDIELVEEVIAKSKQDLKKKLDNLEVKYIREFNTYLKGYNSTLGGDGTLGFKLSEEHKAKIAKRKGWHHTEETKRLISEKIKGKKRSDETKAKLREARLHQVLSEEFYENHKKSMKKFRKKVAQYDFEGNLIRVHDSITSASETSGVNVHTISGVCNNKRQSAGGYYWKFIKGDKADNKIDTNVNVKAIEGSKAKAVNQFDKEGNHLKSYSSIREASKETNVVLSSIVENCKGKRKSAGGYVWKYSMNGGN
ncbi:hypothetical protein A6E27_01545 [Bacillus cereus]|nr:hypothetical protein A6E27_01545 [Bacillus cereus]